MSISANPDSVRCTPTDSSGTAMYQPIGKVTAERFTHTQTYKANILIAFFPLLFFSKQMVTVHSFSEGALIKSHYFSYVNVSEDTRVGGPGAKYTW